MEITYELADDSLIANFFHELAHWIFYEIEFMMDGKYLHQNEQFISLVAGCLHQALTTMEYNHENTRLP